MSKRVNPPSLATTLAGIAMDNPVMVASGTFGYGPEYADLVDINCLGALVVKGICLEAWNGNDVPRMIELVRLTEPGPFDSRTIQFGNYLGIYDGDTLVAMAGERLRPMGWVEISGVCTHPTARGRGLAAALVKELVARARSRDEHAFLNVLKGSPSEQTAIGVYERLGFQFYQSMTIFALLKL